MRNGKYIPQRRNANRHTQRGLRLLEDSIQRDGWIGGITVAADGEATRITGAGSSSEKSTTSIAYSVSPNPSYFTGPNVFPSRIFSSVPTATSRPASGATGRSRSSALGKSRPMP